MTPRTTPPLRAAWLVWGLGALLYLMGFFQRVAPAVMTDELMGDFGINAAGLGNLSAFYFYSYVAMQVPTGVLADRWGPRRLLAAGAFVAGLGTLLFAVADGILWAGMGRLLIGGSVAVAFVGLLKVASNWFPVRQFALVSGLALFTGIVGAVLAGPPLRLLMSCYSWRTIMAGSAVFTFLICAGIWFFVRDTPSEKGYADFLQPGTPAAGNTRPSIIGGIVEVFRYPNTRLLCVIPAGTVGCVLTFSGLWGVPYLATHHQLTTTGASVLSTALMVAWAVGGPAFGWFSDRLGRRKPLYLLGCGLSLVGWGGILFLNNLPVPLLAGLLVLTGFCSGCMIISFAFAKESVPLNLAGTVSGVVNMGVMMGPMILQPAVGWILDQNWQGQAVAGVRVYPLTAYQAGFSLMLAWLALGFVLLFFTRETRCKQVMCEDKKK
ncbi:MAG: MFS transporter [Desulfomonile tiedjei]|nr:MFS transporter [Desulfomonile tiedjei]